MRRITSFLILLPSVLAGLLCNAAARPPEPPDWVQRSNEHSQILLRVLAKFSPEEAGRLGVSGFDTRVLDLSPGFTQRRVRALEEAHAELQALLAKESDGPVKQDLEILRGSAEDELQDTRLDQKHLLPYFKVAEIIYQGIRNLLEDRIPPERRQAALTRLKRYAGREHGYKPLAQAAEVYLRSEWAKPGRLSAFRGEVERDLNTSENYVKEIGELFQQYGLKGYEADYQAFTQQVAAYNGFLRQEILSRARKEFRLPDEVYAFRLKRYGVDMPVDELRRRALVAFQELQDQLQALAFRIAQERKLASSDYREVLRALKSEQLSGATILPHYQQRMKTLEEIIRRERIVTLPARSLRIRLATEAESARAPAPFMSSPRLIGNTGEYGEFVLPVRLAGGSDGSTKQMDDFTNEAASWPLAAHEGRPGHELQYASIVEKGVSQARLIFAENSVNVEGWGLYMEEQMLPYLPLEGQFATLWSRMVRAARAFLDPGLNAGTITREEARRVLQDELVLSDALSRPELERYTFRGPGQATSYFNGYLRLVEPRAESELLLGKRFDKQAFHDFILAQGLLPPALLRQAVLRTFVPGHRTPPVQ
jgi:uncharacterized protein (DUF885 family)